MARGDDDLFFRRLRHAGLTKPAVEALTDKLAELEARIAELEAQRTSP